MKKEEKARILFNLPEIYSANTADWIIKNEFNPFLKHEEDESGSHELPIINDEQRSNTSSRLLNDDNFGNDYNDDLKHNDFYNVHNNGPQPVAINDPREMQANLNSIPQNTNASFPRVDNDSNKNFPFEEDSHLFHRRLSSINRHESNFKIYRMAPCFKTVIHIIVICVLLSLLILLIEPHQPETLDMPGSNNIENNQSYIYDQHNEVNDRIIENEMSNENNVGIFDFNRPISIIKSFFSKFFPAKVDEELEKNTLYPTGNNSPYIFDPDLVFDDSLKELDMIEEKFGDFNFMGGSQQDDKMEEYF